MTRAEVVSRLRNSIKEVSGDSLYSDRYLWNLFQTGSRILLKQEAQKGNIYSQVNIWENICVFMEPVSPIVCKCISLPYDCKVMRSRDKLPGLAEYSGGLIYRYISTPDLSVKFTLVTPYEYSVKTRIKYVKEKFAFLDDNYLYTPSSDYPLLSISAIFDGDTSKFKCDDNDTSSECGSALKKSSGLPQHLEDYVIKQCLQELGLSKQIPQDEHPNSNDAQKQGSP